MAKSAIVSYLLGTVNGGTAVSSTTVYTSATLSFAGNEQAAGSIDVQWTGTPTGTYQIQCSNDNVTWTNVTARFSPTPTQPSGSASNSFNDIPKSGALSWRVVYTNASGSGTMTIVAVTK